MDLGGTASTFWLFRARKVSSMFLFNSFEQRYIPHCEYYHTFLYSGRTVVGSHGCSTRFCHSHILAYTRFSSL